MSKNGTNNKGPNDLKYQIDFLTSQNNVLKVALRKAVREIHTLKYENDVLNRKIKIAEDWVGQLKEVDL